MKIKVGAVALLLVGLTAGAIAAVPPTSGYEPVVAQNDQSHVASMKSVIDQSKAKGTLDMAAVSQVYKNAVASKADAEVMGAMTGVAVSAYPDRSGNIVSSALAPYQGTPHRLVLWNVMNSAVMSHPRPFSTVLPVSDVLMKSVDHSKDDQYAAYIKYIAARIASTTPDNPLNNTNKGDAQKGLAIKRNLNAAAGYNVLFLEVEIGLNPFFVFPEPVSGTEGVVVQR